MTNMHDIIYEDASLEAIIFNHTHYSDTATTLSDRVYSRYFIKIHRIADTKFQIFDPPSKIHPWQHKIIMDIFKRAGIEVKYRDYKTLGGTENYYVMTNEKQKFAFLLKYGRCKL